MSPSGNVTTLKADQYKVVLPGNWQACYEKRPFMVSHNLTGSDEFSIDALQALARRIPPDQIELNAGDVPVSLPSGKSADSRLSASDYIGDIKSERVWVGLLRLANDRRHGPILAEIMEPIGRQLSEIDPGMNNIDGFMFITSPHSVVPYHMDPEHNFLLQISGTKEFVIFDKNDPEVVSDELFEWFYSQQNRRLKLSKRLLDKGRSVILQPGQGLHVPICAPHFVRTLEDVSISLSITYATPKWNRREDVYRVNRRLRRFGVEPDCPGGYWDPVKASSHRAWVGLKRKFVVSGS